MSVQKECKIIFCPMYLSFFFIKNLHIYLAKPYLRCVDWWWMVDMCYFRKESKGKLSFYLDTCVLTVTCTTTVPHIIANKYSLAV